MTIMKQAFLALFAAAVASAVNISVGSRGGNITGGFHYGFLHEVRSFPGMDGIESKV